MFFQLCSNVTAKPYTAMYVKFFDEESREYTEYFPTIMITDNHVPVLVVLQPQLPPQQPRPYSEWIDHQYTKPNSVAACLDLSEAANSLHNNSHVGFCLAVFAAG